MKRITVNASTPYEVRIGGGVLRQAGAFCRELHGSGPCRAAVITDDTVAELHLPALLASLEEAGIPAEVFRFAPGENSKTLAVYGEIVEFLARNRLTRSDWIIALGGGIPGDVAGFAAATYLRGIRFLQIPTTLLAALDSSVGGKTAVNLGAGKNLCGAFHQPSGVLCDPDALATLPEATFAEGAAEGVKYGVIADAELFAKLEAGAFRSDLEAVIARCVSIKAAVVAEDEFDTGRRQLLNFGHTLGHAVEKCSDFAIAHGNAVAIGMVLAARTAAAHRIAPPELPLRLEALLRKLRLPTGSPFSTAELLAVAAGDKKRTGDTIKLVLPRRIGECFLHPLRVAELPEFFSVLK